MKYSAMYTFVTRHTCAFSRTIWPFRKTELDYVIELLKKEEGIDTVLDYGCNDGHFSVRMKEEVGASVVGADINGVALEYAREHHPDIEFEYIDEGYEKKHPEAFDAVVMLHTLEHIRDRAPILRSIHSVLKREGVFIVAVPQERIRGDATVPQLFLNFLTGTFENPHVVSFTKDTLTKELEDAGFEVTHHKFSNYFAPKLSDERTIHSWSIVVVARKQA